MNPPLVINDVEVVSINPMDRTFSLVVHVKAAPMQMYTPEILAMVSQKTKVAVKYLVDEGFIDDPEITPWKMNLVGVCEPPTSSL